MSRIKTTFDRLKTEGKTALIPYIMAGDPDVETSTEILQALAENGADVIELGMPFSDPMADGPTIQAAGIRSLKAGTKLVDVFAMVKNLRATNDSIPVVLMGYLNNICAYGEDAFIQKCVEVGVDGLLIVDLPLEEASQLTEKLKPHGIDLIRLVTPTTKGERLKAVLKTCSGWIYYVAVAGITGGKTADVDGIKPHIDEIKSLSDLPVCIGFGIKTAEDVKRFATIADGTIVGSALVQTIAQADENKAEAAKKFIQSLASH